MSKLARKSYFAPVDEGDGGILDIGIAGQLKCKVP